MVLSEYCYSDPPLHMCNTLILLPLLIILKGEPGILPLGIRNFRTQTGWCGQIYLYDGS